MIRLSTPPRPHRRLADVATVEIGQQSYGPIPATTAPMPPVRRQPRLWGQCGRHCRRRPPPSPRSPRLPKGVEVALPMTLPLRRAVHRKGADHVLEASVWSFLVILSSCKPGAHADPHRTRCRWCCSAPSACWRSSGYSINTLTMFAMVLAIGSCR